MINFNNARFFAGAKSYEDMPSAHKPEIAFWGRSNVGKSSLISSILNNKGLLRISKTPGCTRQMNVFIVGEVLSLVDLPGYGYAKVSKQDSEAWGKSIDSYIRNSKNLACIMLLIDSRRGIMISDASVMEYLSELGKPFSIILTKVDKVKLAESQLSALKDEAENYSAFNGKIYLSSSAKKSGMEEIRKVISRYAK